MRCSVCLTRYNLIFIIDKFCQFQKIIDKHGFSTFVRLASRFIEDDEAECHRYAATAIRELTVKVSDAIRNDIYLATKDWIESEKPGPRYIGARSLTELVKVQEFKLNDERVKAILETVINRYFNKKSSINEEEEEESEENEDDESENEVEAALNLLVELIRNYLDLVRNALKKSTTLQTKLIG